MKSTFSVKSFLLFGFHGDRCCSIYVQHPVHQHGQEAANEWAYPVDDHVFPGRGPLTSECVTSGHCWVKVHASQIDACKNQKTEWTLDNVYLTTYEKFGRCHKVATYLRKTEHNLFAKI